MATEVAAGASLAGIRSLGVMKQNGANVAADFIVNLNMTGIGSAGMVIFISDDPGGGTSNNEQDSRIITKWIDNPLMEPSSAQEAKEMIKWAYEGLRSGKSADIRAWSGKDLLYPKQRRCSASCPAKLNPSPSSRKPGT